MNTGSINSGYYASSKALASGGNEQLAVYAAKSAQNAQKAVLQTVTDAMEQSKKIGKANRGLSI